MSYFVSRRFGDVAFPNITVRGSLPHMEPEDCRPAMKVPANGKHAVPAVADTLTAVFNRFAGCGRYFPGYAPVQRRKCPVTARQAPRLQRARVELRLFPATADSLYQRAAEWNVSVSEAGNRLIDAGLASTANSGQKT